MKSYRSRNLIAALAALLTIGWGAVAFSQGAPHGQPQPAAHPGPSANNPQRGEQARGETARRLPADVTTEHVITLSDRTLRFKATAGHIPLRDAESGVEQAEIAYIAYVRSDVDPATRPVTFVFNGGPGAASGYLQLGAVGPWRPSPEAASHR